MTEAGRPGVAEKRARLADLEVRKWYDNLARGSEITASNYLRSLFGFCARTGTTPKEVACLTRKAAYRALLDFVSAEEKRGIAGSAITTYVKAVKSWLTFHDVVVDQRIKVKGAQTRPTLENEVVPTQDELRRILLAANPKVRVAAALLAFSGLRPEVLGNYRGNDGLRVRDLPDLEVETDPETKEQTVRFTKLPARVIVRPELSKTRTRYFSLIGSEGAAYIVQFLEQRARGGEHLGPDTDIYHALGRSKQFVKTSKLSESVRDAINRAGCDFRPYNLRCYFDTQLLLAESKGKVASDFRVFWMGHRGKIDATYTTNKGRLPKDLLDEMAEAYRRCEPLLSTVQTGDEREKFKAEVFEILTKAVETATGERADSHLRGEDLIRAIQDALGKAAGPGGPVSLAQGTEPARPHRVPPPTRSGEQRVVDAEAVGRFLEAGWIFQSPLNGRLAVVKWDGTVGP